MSPILLVHIELEYIIPELRLQYESRIYDATNYDPIVIPGRLGHWGPRSLQAWDKNSIARKRLELDNSVIVLRPVSNRVRTRPTTYHLVLACQLRGCN